MFKALVAVLLAASSPMLAQAESVWHQGNGDVVHFDPQHVNSSQTRAAVLAQFAPTKQLPRAGNNAPAPNTSAGPSGLSREQVVRELLQMSAAEKGRLNALFTN